MVWTIDLTKYIICGWFGLDTIEKHYLWMIWTRMSYKKTLTVDGLELDILQRHHLWMVWTRYLKKHYLWMVWTLCLTKYIICGWFGLDTIEKHYLWMVWTRYLTKTLTVDGLD